MVEPKIIRDTAWINNTGSVVTKPTVTNNIPYAVPVDRWNTEYLPDTNYAKLLEQYEELVRTLLSTNIQKDSVEIDSLGHVYITDTVTNNLVKNRYVKWDLKYPQITTTIIMPQPKKNKWYYGGSIEGNRDNIINGVEVGLLLQNKKEQIFGVTAGLTNGSKPVFGVQSYWKIKKK